MKLTASRNSVGELGKPPCRDCFRSGQECILAPSRRGGDYTQFRKPNKRKSKSARTNVISSAADPGTEGNANESPEADQSPLYSELKNPSDALQVLARVATHDGDTTRAHNSCSPNDQVASSRPGEVFSQNALDAFASPGIQSYKLVADGVVLPETILQLLQQYVQGLYPLNNTLIT